MLHVALPQAGSFSSRLQPLTSGASRDLQSSGWGDVLLGGEEGGPTPRQHSLLTPLGRAHGSHLRGVNGNFRSLLLPPPVGSGDRGACDTTPLGDANCNVKEGPPDEAPAAAHT